MLPTIRQLEIFIAVARLRSFSRAASALNMSQSALSQSVRQLEDVLSSSLFDRTRRTITPTRAGQKLLSRAEQILASLEAAVLEVYGENDPSRGKITIACLSLVALRILPRAIDEFRRTTPEASIRVRDDFMSRIIDSVRSGEADVGIGPLLDSDESVNFVPLLQEAFYFVCPTDHPLARTREIQWSDLAGSNVVSMGASSSIRTLLDRALASREVMKHAIYEVGRVTSVLEIVMQGGGVSVVPALALADSHVRERVHFRQVSSPEMRRVLGLITKRNVPLSATAASFQQILMSSLRHSGLAASPGIKLLVD